MSSAKRENVPSPWLALTPLSGHQGRGATAAASMAKWERATPLSKAELNTGLAPCARAQAANCTVRSSPCNPGLRIKAAMGAWQPSRSSRPTVASVRLSSTAIGTRCFVRVARLSQSATRLAAPLLCFKGSSQYSVSATAQSERLSTNAAASSTAQAWLASKRNRASCPFWRCNSSASLLVLSASSLGSFPTLTFTTAGPWLISLRSSSLATRAFTLTCDEQLNRAAAVEPRSSAPT
mmetsp:Transcript_16240/g.38097  ORF Transcript_16240/g.38097 Transcript_16240/m.38097 type:complete len:237 (+) Transcript_16240:284-994(+)